MRALCSLVPSSTVLWPTTVFVNGSQHISRFFSLTSYLCHVSRNVIMPLKGIISPQAELTCTASEFDVLASRVGLKGHKPVATDSAERRKYRAELDGLIAHLYGLTEGEFAHILSTFPLVPDAVKVAAQNAYRDVERGLVR